MRVRGAGLIVCLLGAAVILAGAPSPSVPLEGPAPAGPPGLFGGTGSVRSIPGSLEGPAPSGPFRMDGTEAVPPQGLSGLEGHSGMDGTEAVPPQGLSGLEAHPETDGTEAVPPEDAADPFAGDAVDEAIRRAVAYLVRQQGEDGSIDDGSRGRGRGGHVHGNSTAMTSLAIMALASVGHEPGDRTPEGEALRKALDCVLEPRRMATDQRRQGYLGGPDGSRMYGHGIATLMLAEMLGLGASDADDKRIRSALREALDLILRSQKVRKDDRSRGGWRYEPDSSDADLSVTVWHVMALRAAKNAGLDIPKDAIDAAAAYIRRTYPSHDRVRQGLPLPKGAFAYQPGGRAEYSTASAGLLALQVCGHYEDPTVKGAADWLLENGPRWYQDWFFYGTYYYAQGMFQRGGLHAAEARKKVEEILLREQEKGGDHAGCWRAPHGQEQGAGRVYSTCLAVLSLSVKYHYLPIYQR